MNMLDRKLKLRLEVLKMETKLLIRYIDDVKVIMERIRLGSVIRGNRVEIDQEQMVMDTQLADPSLVAAPVSTFAHAPMADGWDNIMVDMKVELEDSDADPIPGVFNTAF